MDRGRNPRKNPRRNPAHGFGGVSTTVPRQACSITASLTALRHHPEMGSEFVESLPVRKFHGVGPATPRRWNASDRNRARPQGADLGFLQQHFGKAGSYYYWAARASTSARPRRSDTKIGRRENTFPADLFTYEAARDALREIVDKVWSTVSAPVFVAHRHTQGQVR